VDLSLLDVLIEARHQIDTTKITVIKITTFIIFNFKNLTKIKGLLLITKQKEKI
jgi:hypothetical protein